MLHGDINGHHTINPNHWKYQELQITQHWHCFILPNCRENIWKWRFTHSSPTFWGSTAFSAKKRQTIFPRIVLLNQIPASARLPLRLPISETLQQLVDAARLTRKSNGEVEKRCKDWFFWLVVEPTHLKNILVKLDHFPRDRGWK